MNAAHPTPDSSAQGDVNSRLLFFKNLQAVTNKIHATSNIDEIMLELSQDICNLFNADRLTIYTVSEDRSSIVSKVKTGLNSFKDLKLPITEQSVAGYVAMTQKMANIRDVYDDVELKAYSPKMNFLQEVDKRTGYRTKQMLVAPISDGEGALLGVVQIINNRDDVPFAAVAEEGVQGLAQTLAIAFTQRQKAVPGVRSKYDGLVSDAVISAAELDLAQRSARRKGLDLEEVLVKEFQVKPAAIGQALAKYFGDPYEPYRSERVKPIDLLRNLKRDYLESQQWVPVEETREGVVVVATDPERVRNSRVVNNIFPKSKVVYRVTTNREFLQVLDHFFGALADVASVGDLLSDLGDGDDEAGDVVGDDVSAAAENELVKLVNKIIIEAYQQGASDIHIEPRPGKEKTLIRFRKDGSLVPYIEIPASYRNALIARLKIMCDLDISEKRKPQDGKIKFKKYGPLDIELRVATIPTAGGMEDVVMRILAAGEPIPLDSLGLTPHNHETLKSIISKPYGLFFVCGPTGSGKTTTLHSILGHINTPDTKIWTAEDPVEITQKGLRQVQINKKAGLDFATVMRSFLRADPDVIMVGEMRDAETTGIGIEASLTGHLVFATLHTNSAPESVIRLLDMGMDPFNFADALLGILAQRLAKRLCKECKEAYQPSPEDMKRLLTEYCEELTNTDSWKKDPKGSYEAVYRDWNSRYAKDGQFTLYRPKGCPVCNDTGYKGRVGLHELMAGTDGVKKLIQEHARVAELVACALNDGMRTLKMDGIDKVLQGITDMKQVHAVCIK
ncbi:type II secretory ATPase GspE/PulE/Tfp pilus assembly ATPase PilB-like protein [Azospira oryzae]|jgi:type II secretory ATPase GspE/PulE/Tfp pilus assembly ATPase PilB-like protein|uniref:Type II secretory ATPase GspE/PulE/Tfp pilus assembly ATPase PilB-like protein n=1 Tax=Azospira oryzae TaxID=146939 RepID=A0ABY0IKY1_9RHOO|nr:GspE/PulE family protein [Azospira oryzae]RZT75854.1 type II secretory ATPase GspE/PulE/Tfp pilus assembly ATPase PilB-like protein [Azospira oryzae]